MPRGGSRYKKQEVQMDQVYGDPRIAKFINYVMESGKKDVARRIVYEALEVARKQLNQDDVPALFARVLDNVRPGQEVRSRRVGGATYQVPMPVPKVRSEALALKWIIEVARKRKGTTMTKKLAQELINAYNSEGDAVTKKENVHKMAEANRAFSHFRW